MRDTAGNTATPAARRRKVRRGSFVLHLPLASHHSITSSARASSVGGTSRPSALAVLRLITSSYLFGRCKGRVAWFYTAQLRGAKLPYRLLYILNQFLRVKMSLS